MNDLEKYGLGDAVDKAFDSAGAGYYFDGKLLEPYSERRMRCAGSMGLRFGYLSDDDCTTFAKSGRYPGIDQDVAIVLWLCIQPDAAVNRALRFPDIASEDLNVWADSAGISPGGNLYKEAVDVFWQIQKDIKDSETEDAEATETGGAGETPGKPIAEGHPTESPSPPRLGTPSIFANGVSRSPAVSNISPHTSPAEA